MKVPVSLPACILFGLVLLPFISGIVWAASPMITDIDPDSESNTSRSVIVNITGANFATGAQVLLVPAGVHPVHAASISDGGGSPPFLNGPLAVSLSGSNAYIVSQWSNSLEVLDIADPSRPVHKGSLHNGTGGALLSAPRSVYVSGTRAYVASSGNNALEIVDISDAGNPVHKGSIVNGTGGTLLQSPRSVFISGNYAYVTGYSSNTLEIVDISDPSVPVHAGVMKSDSLLKNPTSVSVSGSHAYVTSAGNNALEIVDVSDPANPFHRGILKDGIGGATCLKSPTYVQIAGNFAYVTSAGSNALEIVDVRNPAAPSQKACITNGFGGVGAVLLGEPSGVFVSGHYAYVASGGSYALEILDVSNPAVPVHLGVVTNGTGGALLENPSAVYVSGRYAYVTGKTGNSLEILDIGNVTSIPSGSVTFRSGSALTCEFDLTHTLAGEYDVLVANPGGPPGTLPGGFTITAPRPPPLVTGISPSVSANTTGSLTANITGANFNTSFAPSVKLNRTGYADVLAVNISLQGSSRISCMFDLTGLETGYWNIVVTNPDGQDDLFVNGFSIVPTDVPAVSPTQSPQATGENSVPYGNGRYGQGQSFVATSPGAPAGGVMSFAVSKNEETGFYGNTVSIHEVTIIPSRPTGPVDLIITDAGLNVLPPKNGHLTAGIVSIEPVAMNPSAISSGTITFSVTDDWLRANGLTPAHIVLMRLENGIWSELPTTYTERSGNAHYFTAATPGFSYFSISTHEILIPLPEGEASATPRSYSSGIPASSQSSSSDLTVPASPGLSADDRQIPIKARTTPVPASETVPREPVPLGIVALAGLISGASVSILCIRRWWIRRQNPVLFKKYD